MGDTCQQCKHWQGTKYTKAFADCHRVMLNQYKSLQKVTDRFGNKIGNKLDPHDTMYHLSTSELHQVLEELPKLKADLMAVYGWRIVEQLETVYVMDDHGDITTKQVRVPYCQTFKEGYCDQWQSRKKNTIPV